VNTAVRGGLQIFPSSTTPSRQTHAVDAVAQRVDVINFRLTHRGNAEFKFRHAGTGERSGDPNFFCARKRHPRCLLAVSQRGVNEMYTA
jgi:hypothetical protein